MGLEAGNVCQFLFGINNYVMYIRVSKKATPSGPEAGHSCDTVRCQRKLMPDNVHPTE